jgi:hypothetical protein
MFCGNCGAKMTEGQRYCNVCGKPLEAVNAPAAGTPLDTDRGLRGEAATAKHIRVLGYLWVFISVLRLIPSAGLFIFPRIGIGFPFFPMHFPGFMWPLLASLRILFMSTAIAGLIAGWGLLQRASWARTLAIVLGILSLIHVPFGTALGIYTLWVLLPSDSEREFKRTSSAA